MKCRHCDGILKLSLINLGVSPPSNAYITTSDKHEEDSYPLHVLVCEECWLAQTEDFTDAKQLFTNDYPYFSSFSSSWLLHCKNYVKNVQNRFGLNHSSTVVEIAANDGYLLQYFKNRQIPCYGIEPTNNTAAAARAKGLEIIDDFFGVSLATQLANQGRHADLIVANNVLAHVPDINDFVSGFTLLLKPKGVATFEFPHLCELISNNQFDTIYHEHFSYLSLTSAYNIFTKNGLDIFDVEKLNTHGGSLRVYAQRLDYKNLPTQDNVGKLLGEEIEHGINTREYYLGFAKQANLIRNDFIAFINDAKQKGKKIAGYGAAAKGNTLLNFSSVNYESIPYVIDKNPNKQNKRLPGSHIPIVNEDVLEKEKPDYIIIFPWNISDEIVEQLEYARDWGAVFITVIPSLKYL